MAIETGTRPAHYEITGRLRAGGVGEVNRAPGTKLDREVAIKVLPEKLSQDPERLSRFARQAKAVAALSHSNILRDGRVKIDFGRAKPSPHRRKRSPHHGTVSRLETGAGIVPGTVGYMAPEQVGGNRPIIARTSSPSVRFWTGWSPASAPSRAIRPRRP